MAVVGTATVEIHATLEAVRGEIRRGLDEALAGMNTNIKVSVDVDDALAKAKLSETKATTDELGAKSPTINVDAETAGADAKLIATKALADETGKKRTVKTDADTKDAEDALIGLGTVLDKLGLQADAFGTGTQLKIGAIAGAIPTVGAAIGSAFAALPALLAAIGAGAGAVMVGFSGVGTVIKGMSPDATAADMKKMNQELAQMGPNAQAVSTQLGAMVNGPLHQLKGDIQENLLGKLNGDFGALSSQTLPIVDTGMKNIAGTMGTGLHNSIQTVISSGPQLTSMFGGMNDFLGVLSGQSIPSFIQSFINMGGAAAGGMKAVGDGINSIFTGFQSMIDQQVKLGTFQQAVSGLGPIFAGLGNVLNPLLSMVITLGANLAGPLSGALTAIGNLITPLTPILSSVGQQFLSIVTVVAQQLLPIFTDMTPAFENLVNSLGQLLVPILQAVGPALGQLVQGFLEFAKAMEPLYGPTSLTVTAMQGLGQIMEAIAPLIGTVGTALGELVDALSQALAPVIPIIVGAIKTLADALGPVVQAAGEMASTLINALAPVLPLVAQALADLMKAVAPLLPALADLAGTVVKDLAPILPALATAFIDIVKAVIPLVPVLAQLIPPFTSLVNVILPPLVSLLTFIADHAWMVEAAFAAWMAVKFTGQVAEWASGLTDFTTKLSYLGSTVDDAKGYFDKLQDGWKALKDFPSTIGPAITGIKDFVTHSGLATAATKVWSGVQIAFNAIMDANPIAIIILAIIALIAIIVLVITHWSDVKRIVGEVWDKITGFATWLGGEFVSAWHTVSGAIVSAWNTVMSWFTTALNAFVGFFRGIWTGISSFFTGIWDGISSFVVGVWNDIAGFFTGAFNAFVGFFKGIWDGLSAYFSLLWEVRFKQPVMAIWNAIAGFFQVAFAAFVAFFEGIWNGISSFFSMIWDGIKTAAQFIWNLIKSFFIIEFNGFKAIFEFIWNAISTVFSTVWNFIKSVAETVWNAIAGFFTTAFNTFKAGFEIIWNAVSGVFSTVWNFIKGIAETVWSAISGYFTNAFNVFKGAFEVIWNAVSGVFNTVWNTIKGIATTVWGAISGFFSGAFRDFQRVFSDAWNAVSKVFSDVWNGIKKVASDIWDGIKSAFVGGINAVIDFINGMIHGVNKVLNFLLLPSIGDIPKLEGGGTLTLNTVFTGNAVNDAGSGVRALATGGALFEPVGPGFKTSGPKAIVGEGNPAYPEYVIPTDPTYRGNATALLRSAMTDMGMESGGKVAMLAGGGSLWDTITGVAGAAWHGITNAADAVGSAIGNAFDSITSWIDSAVASTIHGVAHGVEKLFPDNLIGHMATGAVEKMADGLISMIGAGEQKKKATEAAAATAAGGGNSAVPASRASNVAAVQSVAATMGWGSGAEWDALVKLINRESGFNNVAQNPTSTAYGMFQFLNSTWSGYGISKTSDPYLQSIGGLGYIRSRYGDPLGAWAHEVSAGWYDDGGWLKPGTTFARNDTGHGEMILPEAKLAEIIQKAWGTNLTQLWSEWNHGLEQAVKRAYGDRVEDKIEAKLQDMLRHPQPPPPIVIPPPPPLPPLPQTSTAVAATMPGGDLGAAFRAALSQFAPELSQAISAGSANQIVTLGTELLANPQRMAAINASIADALVQPVTDMAGMVQDTISSALPTAHAQGGTVDPTMGAAGTLHSAQSTVSTTSASSSSNDVTIHPGAFQVTVAGNADAVTVAQLQAVLRDWNDELLHQVRGRR